MIRKPAVAGLFYPDNKDDLSRQIASFTKKKVTRENILGVMSPHAGYMYSGHTAGDVFSRTRVKPNVVILGPNHTGLGTQFSVSSADSWVTPLGAVDINRRLALQIMKRSKRVSFDDEAHEGEHSVEVQLPFLQNTGERFSFVPIVVSYASLGIYQEIGMAIAESIKELGEKDNTIIIASSDMTHYESAGDAKNKDTIAINAILKLDEKLLVESVEKNNISMCGFAPVAIMLSAVKELGAKTAELVTYTNSGEATGDYSSVVGYAGIVVK